MRTLILTLPALVLLAACASTGASEITNFEECIAAGNPAMESYPRQCRAGDRTFVEEIDAPAEPE